MAKKPKFTQSDKLRRKNNWLIIHFSLRQICCCFVSRSEFFLVKHNKKNLLMFILFSWCFSQTKSRLLAITTKHKVIYIMIAGQWLAGHVIFSIVFDSFLHSYWFGFIKFNEKRRNGNSICFGEIRFFLIHGAGGFCETLFQLPFFKAEGTAVSRFFLFLLSTRWERAIKFKSNVTWFLFDFQRVALVDT